MSAIAAANCTRKGRSDDQKLPPSLALIPDVPRSSAAAIEQKRMGSDEMWVPHFVNVAELRRVRPSALACCFFVFVLLLLCGCDLVASHQIGPSRAISIDEDVLAVRPLAVLDDDHLATFYRSSPALQASIRNQVITARMYLIDIEYNRYEARLTQELQNEGLAATVASLGLTTSAALIPVAHTSQLLSGIATGVTGLDKAYTEKELLDYTIQALQGQMRTDRKTQAAAIYSKMFIAVGSSTSTTPIDQYTLAMALSDTDHYYQAGTMASALIGLSKTVSNAEQNAESAKDLAGPNAPQVTTIRAIATPLPTNGPQGPAPTFGAVPFTPASPVQAKQGPPVPRPDPVAAKFFQETNLSQQDIDLALGGLCFDKYGAKGLSEANLIKALVGIYDDYQNYMGKPVANSLITRQQRQDMEAQPDCGAAKNFYEKITFANTSNAAVDNANAISGFAQVLNRATVGGAVAPSSSLANYRAKIKLVRADLKLTDVPSAMNDQVTATFREALQSPPPKPN